MTVALPVIRLSRPARSRRGAGDLLTGAPVLLLAAAGAWRVGGTPAALAAALIVGIVLALVIIWRSRKIDYRWLIRALDARRCDMEDSADLLFAPDERLSAVQRLQRARLERRLDADAAVDLRPAWAIKRIAAAWLIDGVLLVAVLAVPTHPAAPILAPSDEVVAPRPGVPHLVGQRLRVVPPAYTGLPAHGEATLDIRAPQGSHLDWTVRFAPQPTSANLAFADGGRTALMRHGDVWTASRVLDRSNLYRVTPMTSPGQPLPRLHRLEAIVDAPPEVRVIAPAHSLVLIAPGQHAWHLTFAANDDYGVAATAQLHVTIAEGEGETIKFREQIITVRGTGNARTKRFDAQLDLAALKFVAGSDLVTQLAVSDTRQPGPQTVRSASIILRWPAATGDGAGAEGVAASTLPAYFRSERQIIIDAEALLKERARLAPDRFLARSDAVAADQRLLRLRYGQFLGEEQEGKTPPPTADAEAPVAQGDGKPAPPAFGSEASTLADYGHVHDESEAATLLDPGTRTSLKAALDQMWQAELNLHQGAPVAALPFAYRALGLIKQVQQATRIFLARVGPDLPPIDESRRLTGKRDGLDHRDLPGAAGEPVDPAAGAVWQALATPVGPTAVQLSALDRWLRASPTTVADPLALVAAIDTVRREPGCGECRQMLRKLLWSALPQPAPTVLRRDDGDAAGRRYLDALRTK